MASPNPELSLECKPQSYSMLLKSFGGDQLLDQTHKLEDFLARLEEEQLKIDAFKRELPLCMQLLTNAVEASRQQLQAYKENQVGRPVLEEFIPLKNPSSGEPSEMALSTNQIISDKSNWMTSAQLWSQAAHTDVTTKHQNHSSLTTSKLETDIGFNVSPKLALEPKQRNGAFTPFSKDRNSCPNHTTRELPDLALASHEKELEEKKCPEIIDGSGKCGNGKNGGVVDSEQGKGCNSAETQTIANGNSNNNNNQTHRKARRCWSPDLHRRFVHALQMLGGSQVATPKQIRELMKVDGLTNDEVKSHLQKYRLHTRRPSPSPQPTGGPGPQLVVLGGIWVSPEYAAAAAAAHGGSTTLYGTAHPTSHAPTHYCGPPPLAPSVAQEFYATSTAAQSHQLFHQHQQLQLYKTTSHGSPEYGGGNRSESIEDGKSESSSWKGESGENGGERKGLAALREDGEESNGSDITLKF